MDMTSCKCVNKWTTENIHVGSVRGCFGSFATGGKFKMQQKQASHLKGLTDKWIIHNAHSGISGCVFVCERAVTLMDSFISLAPFMCLWGSLLAAQTKASVCVLMRPGRGSGEELDTCGMGVHINKCLRSHPFFLSPLSPRTQKFLSGATLRFCI